GLPLPGSAVSLAGQAAGHADARHRAAGAGDLLAEPRSGREFRARRTFAPADRSRPLPRDDRGAAAGAPDAAALPGAGILRLVTVALFRRSHPGAGQTREERPPRVPRAVPQSRDARDGGLPGRSG